MRSRSFLAVTLALVSIAGCIQSPDLETASTDQALASLPLFDVNASIKEPLTLTLADGTDLALTVWRPESDEPVPVIVDIGPYFRTDMLEYTAIDLRLAEYFVPRGYAVARAALRGTGASEGCFSIGDAQEQRDVHDIVQYLGEQTWSSGSVAAFGKSYDGTTPWMAAITKPDALKAIVPISGISDMYRYTYYDGASYSHGPIFNTYYPLDVDYDVPLLSAPITTNAQQNVKTCAATESAPVIAKGYETFVRGDHDAYWDERDYEQEIPEIDVGVFLIHGLQDWNVKPDNGVPLYNLIQGPKMMWLGQWEHDYPDINRFNPDWSRHDFNETLLQFFDHFLKGYDNGWTSGHVEVQDQLGVWRDYTAWPPVDATEQRWALAAGGVLSSNPEEGSEERTFSDPLGQGYDAATSTGGAAYVSEPLAAPMRMVGRPTVHVNVTLQGIGGNLAVALYDVAPDGTWTEVNRGYKDIRHRASRDAGEPASPMETMEIAVDLYPQELVFDAGHQVAVVVSAELPAWIMASPLRAPTYTIGAGGLTFLTAG